MRGCESIPEMISDNSAAPARPTISVPQGVGAVSVMCSWVTKSVQGVRAGVNSPSASANHAPGAPAPKVVSVSRWRGVVAASA